MGLPHPSSNHCRNGLPHPSSNHCHNGLPHHSSNHCHNGLPHPSSNHYRNGFRHTSQKTVSPLSFPLVFKCRTFVYSQPRMRDNSTTTKCRFSPITAHNAYICQHGQSQNRSNSDESFLILFVSLGADAADVYVRNSMLQSCFHSLSTKTSRKFYGGR